MRIRTKQLTVSVLRLRLLEILPRNCRAYSFRGAAQYSFSFLAFSSVSYEFCNYYSKQGVRLQFFGLVPNHPCHFSESFFDVGVAFLDVY